MKHKALFTVLTVIILVSSLTSVLAGNWTAPTLTGYWDPLTPETGFKGSGDNSGQLTTYWDSNDTTAGTQAIENFSGFWLNCSLLNLNATLRSWSLSDYKSITVDLKLLSGFGFGGQVNTNFSMYAKTTLDGSGNERKITFGATSYAISSFPTQFNIYYSKISNTTLDLSIAYFDKGGKTTFPNGTSFDGFFVYLNKTITVDPLFFDWDMVIALTVTHEGSGNFQFFLYGQQYQNGDVPNKTPGFDVSKAAQEYTSWEQEVVDWFNGVKNFILGGFSALQTMAIFIGTFLVQLTPILPYLFLFYLLDVIITSVHVGSVQPIGKFVMMMWEFMLRIWDVIINIGSFVVNALTSWIP